MLILHTVKVPGNTIEFIDDPMIIALAKQRRARRLYTQFLQAGTYDNPIDVDNLPTLCGTTVSDPIDVDGLYGL